MTKKRSKKEYQELLTRYLEGKCTKEELEAVDQWYSSFDQDNGDAPDMDNLPDLKNEMFENIGRAIDDQEFQTRNPHHHERPFRNVKVIRLHSLKRLAAVITIGIGLGILIYFQRHNFSRGQEVNSTLSYEQHAQEHPKVDGPATVYLPDGSVVWLNEKSRLEYPEAFTDAGREITLIGEAFFDVARDSGRPFVIHSTNFTTRVLGTSFKIKDYEDEESHEVEVVTGKVMVSVNGAATDSVKELILKPKRKAVYSKKDNSLVESAAGDGSLERLTTKSKLEFNEVALKDIVKVLNVAHGVNITISNERMKNCIVTADLRNETLDISIAILAKAINAEFSVRGKDIILSGKGCGDSQP